MANVKIDRTHSDYARILAHWQSQQQPASFSFGGVRYLAVRDNDELNFIAEMTEGQMPFYEQTTVRKE